MTPDQIRSIEANWTPDPRALDPNVGHLDTLLAVCWVLGFAALVVVGLGLLCIH